MHALAVWLGIAAANCSSAVSGSTLQLQFSLVLAARLLELTDPPPGPTAVSSPTSSAYGSANQSHADKEPVLSDSPSVSPSATPSATRDERAGQSAREKDPPPAPARTAPPAPPPRREATAPPNEGHRTLCAIYAASVPARVGPMVPLCRSAQHDAHSLRPTLFCL